MNECREELRSSNAVEVQKHHQKIEQIKRDMAALVLAQADEEHKLNALKELTRAAEDARVAEEESLKHIRGVWALERTQWLDTVQHEQSKTKTLLDANLTKLQESVQQKTLELSEVQQVLYDLQVCFC